MIHMIRVIYLMVSTGYIEDMSGGCLSPTIDPLNQHQNTTGEFSHLYITRGGARVARAKYNKSINCTHLFHYVHCLHTILPPHKSKYILCVTLDYCIITVAGLRGWLWRPVDPTIMFPMLISLILMCHTWLLHHHSGWPRRLTLEAGKPHHDVFHVDIIGL